MATILQFVPRENSPRATVHAADARACEIVIFTGVRYERWEQTQTDAEGEIELACEAKPTPRPKRRRRRR